MTYNHVHHYNNTGPELTARRTCPECDSESVLTDDARGEIVCTDCGCVIEKDLIDTGAEWSAYTHDEDWEKSRTGSPLTEMMHDKGMTTKIHWRDADANGRSLSPRKKRQMKRLRTWQERIRVSDAGERNLQLALTEINRMASALGLPDSARENASVVYRRALREDLLQGRSIEGVATSCLYIACRKEGIPRSLDEFETVSRVERSEIGRTYRCLVSNLGIEMKPVDPKQFVPRFCSELDVDQEIRNRAMEILEISADEGITAGKSPPGLAGAAIYLASILSGDSLTQEDISEVAQVTPVTIRNRYQEQLSVVRENE